MGLSLWLLVAVGGLGLLGLLLLLLVLFGVSRSGDAERREHE